MSFYLVCLCVKRVLLHVICVLVNWCCIAVLAWCLIVMVCRLFVTTFVCFGGCLVEIVSC